MSTERTPSVTPVNVFPSGSRNPGAAVVICPGCAARHWVPISTGVPLQTCPDTSMQYSIALPMKGTP
jgi:hypothetical protein